MVITGWNQHFINLHPFPPDPNPGVVVPPSAMTTEGDPSDEECDFDDGVLSYISKMLMEEDMEEKTCMYQESASLQAAERSFYEILVEKHPTSPDHQLINSVDQTIEGLNGCFAGITCSNCHAGSNTSGLIGSGPSSYPSECESPPAQSGDVDLASQSTSQSSFSSSSSAGNVVDGLVDSPVSTLRIPDILGDRQSFLQFKRGVKEANKFLPRINGLRPNSGSTLVKEEDEKDLVVKEKAEEKSLVVQVEKKYESESSLDGSRARKNPHSEQLDMEGVRSNKHSAVYTEASVRSEMFDMVLLCSGGDSDSALREALQNGVNQNMQQNGQSKGSKSGKARGKKQGGKRDVIDLRTLLTLCAQAVSTNDRRSVNELLQQIRRHSSQTGDGMQRIAHYFADGLEARMAGSGTQSYKAVITKPTCAAEILKAYHLFLAVSI